MMTNFENHLRHLLNQLPGLVTWKKPDLTFGFINSAGADLIGYTQEEALGITDYDIRCEAQNFAETFRGQDKAFLDSKYSCRHLNIMRYTNDRFYMGISEKAILKDFNNK